MKKVFAILAAAALVAAVSCTPKPVETPEEETAPVAEETAPVAEEAPAAEAPVAE